MRKGFRCAVLLFAGFAGAQEPPMQPCTRNQTTNCATPPKLTRHVEASYSDYGRRHKINGVVEVSFTVMPDGTTRDITVTKSLEKSLDAAAVDAVRQWSFEPGAYEGKPVPVTLQAEISFHIR